MNTPEIQVRITCISVHSIGLPLGHPPLTFRGGWEHLSSFVSLSLLSPLALSFLFSFNPTLHLLSTIQNMVFEQPLASTFARVHLIEKLWDLTVCLVEDSKPFRVYHVDETDKFPFKQTISCSIILMLLCYNILFLLSPRCCIPTGKWVIGEKKNKEKMCCHTTERWWRWWWWWR